MQGRSPPLLSLERVRAEQHVGHAVSSPAGNIAGLQQRGRGWSLCAGPLACRHALRVCRLPLLCGWGPPDWLPPTNETDPGIP